MTQIFVVLVSFIQYYPKNVAICAVNKKQSACITIYPAVLFKAVILLVNILYTTICAYVPLP